MKLLFKFLPIVFPVVLVLIFFWQFFFKGLLPIPSDTIIGLYHPYRDLYAKDYPRGIPFKNFLITDSVRQQYPWKNLSVDLLKKGEIPLWNPYGFSGTPLLANFQSAVFYPFNILFFVFPFSVAWSLLIVLEVLLASIFMYLYLNNLKLNKWSSFLGSLVFSFSGFSIAWLEWGNILHTAIWLPLILLSIDKIFVETKKLKWSLIFLFALISSFFAGHLQIFFYLFVLSTSYLLFRWFEYGRTWKNLAPFAIYYLLFTIITAVQWIPTLRFIFESARNLDLTPLSEGWFIPWQHLIQFVAPDFFGNPTTLNYWGVWNYGEFVGYIGIFPLILALFALFFKHHKGVIFFGLFFFLSLFFALPNFLSKIPYVLNIPFISTAQPTRLIFLTDFSLAVLAAFGLDALVNLARNNTSKISRKGIFYVAGFIGIVLLVLWIMVLSSRDPNFLVSRQNLILPSILFVCAFLVLLVQNYLRRSNYLILALCFLILLTIFDLFRFGWKFTPFTKSEYLFPATKVLEFLKSQKGEFRIMTTDSRIFAPNFSTVYKIQSVDGYDPLYLQRYGELIAAIEREKPDISGPLGFYRIITPHNTNSKLINLLTVRYVLSLSDLSSDNLTKVFQEGETRVYENKNVMPRAFFAEQTLRSGSKEESIRLLFEKDLSRIAIVEGFKNSMWGKGKATISKYSENSVSIETENEEEGFLVLTDTFYPAWHVTVDGKESKIYRTDYNFRGVIVPKGKHRIEFYISLF